MAALICADEPSAESLSTTTTRPPRRSPTIASIEARHAIASAGVR
jgi:hypothetical protein